MQTDRPIQTAAEDRFQRAPFARRIAEVICTRRDPATLVIGLYGPWGDGKSSTLSLIKEALGTVEGVVQVDYNPWFFSSRLCGRNPCHAFLTGSRIGIYSNHCVTGIRGPDMLTGMTEQDWLITLEVFDAVQSRRGEPGHDDRKFLEAIQYFTVHSITWRALPREFGNWNSVWKRFWRLSRSGVFEAFFQMLAEFSDTAHLVQFFDSTTVRAHVSAAGAKGGSSIRPSAARVAAFRPKSTSRPISTATPSTST